MDIVAAYGMLAETCLLKLSTASRGSVTRAVRHKAKKFLMGVLADYRAEIHECYYLRRQLAQYRVDRHMMQRALASIALNHFDAGETAGVALQRSVGRRVSREEVTLWAQDHVHHIYHGAFADATNGGFIYAEATEIAERGEGMEGAEGEEPVDGVQMNYEESDREDEEEFDAERALEQAYAEEDRAAEARGEVAHFGAI
jgi:hypothetical protein